MSNPYECPNCGADQDEGWSFERGDFNIDDGPLEPDEGRCVACGFGYSQHVLYPLQEQLAAFREHRPKRAIDPCTGKLEGEVK